MPFNSTVAPSQGFNGCTDDDLDPRLVERLKAGDGRAAEEVVRRHSEALLARRPDAAT